MSATETASRVIRWATECNGSAGPPPGDSRDLEKLARPDAILWTELETLCAVATARLHLSDSIPELGGGLSPRPFLVAAALGLAHLPPVARILLKAAGEPATYDEWIAYHALISPALRSMRSPGLGWIDPDVAEDCRAISPLTSALERSAPGREAFGEAAARRLLTSKSGKVLLVDAFSTPTADTNVREWRTRIMDRLRLGSESEQNALLDIYESAMVRHEHLTLSQAATASSVLKNRSGRAGDEALVASDSVARWWGPLWNLQRQDPDALRRRVYMGYEYLKGIELYRLYQKLSAGIGAHVA